MVKEVLTLSRILDDIMKLLKLQPTEDEVREPPHHRYRGHTCS